MAVILAWRDGVVRIEPRSSPDALVLARGPRKRLHDALCICARHAHDSQTLLIPGVPEATNDDDALDAVFAFQRMLEERLTRKARKS